MSAVPKWDTNDALGDCRRAPSLGCFLPRDRDANDAKGSPGDLLTFPRNDGNRSFDSREISSKMGRAEAEGVTFRSSVSSSPPSTDNKVKREGKSRSELELADLKFML